MTELHLYESFNPFGAITTYSHAVQLSLDSCRWT